MFRMECERRWQGKKLKKKGKTNEQTSSEKQNKETNKKVSKIYTGRDSVLINSKLNRH
jgi:hypothetical protein